MFDESSATPLVFQIGFNKCATGALYKLFEKSGVRALHHLGRHHRLAGDEMLDGVNPQEVIERNLRKGRAPVEGLDGFTAFFDMEYTTSTKRIENYRFFASFAEAYPDARFIMNIRPKEHWLKSRIAHNDGRYLQKCCEQMNAGAEEVLRHWADHYDHHIAEVDAYFAAQPHRCLWFDVERDPIGKVLAFFRPWYDLNPKRWKPVHRTNWETVAGGYARTLMNVYQPARPSYAAE